VNTVIFSKDRAAQLDLFFQSLQKNAPQIKTPVTIWTYTSKKFLEGYNRLHSWIGMMVHETSLKSDVLTMVDNRDEQTVFFTDDQVIHGPMPRVYVKPRESFSLRLGKNCTWCYPPHCSQKVGTLDFDYPSIDARIMRTNEFLSIVRGCEWNTPNELENVLLVAWQEYAWRPSILWAEHSCVVSIPHNTVVNNPGVRNYGGTAEELNDRFIRGERLDFEGMDFSNVRACHQEIPLVWKGQQ
jgi:hypothetical protein